MLSFWRRNAGIVVWELLFWIPAYGYAQVENAEETAVSSGGGQQDFNAVDTARSDRLKRRMNRPAREIPNREFSDREKIELLLNGHCDFPTKEDLISTAPEAEKILQEILEDEGVLLSVRMRAIQALSYFSTIQNRAAIEDILAHPEESDHAIMLIQAIHAYAVMAPQDAPRAIAPYLAYNADFVRFVAINSLKNCPGQAALDALKARYAIETNRFFKTRLKQAIDFHCKKENACH